MLRPPVVASWAGLCSCRKRLGQLRESSQGKRRQVPRSQGPQSSHRWAGPQTSSGAHQESQTSSEAGGTGDAVSWKSDVSSGQRLAM